MTRGDFLIPILLFGVLVIGCSRTNSTDTNPADQQGNHEAPSPSTTPPLARAESLKGSGDERGDQDVPGLLVKGGQFWSAPENVSFGGRELKAGSRFWIWPTADKVYVAEGNQLGVVLAWKLRPGQQPPARTGDPIGVELTGSGPGVEFGSYSPAQGVDAVATEGTVAGTFSFEFQGEGEIILYLVGQGRKPLSNLIRLKVKSGN